MKDEVESHHTEQLPLCLWFVDKECNIRKDFLEFEFCCGQRYNGAAKISSEAVGAQCDLKISAKKLLTAIVAVIIWAWW